MTAPFVDELLRGRSDRHKPTYRQLRDEGVSQRAIELLHEGRDMLELGWSPYGFAQWLAQAAVSEADVYPDGKPAHWQRWDRVRAESREVEAMYARQDARYRRHDRTARAAS